MGPYDVLVAADTLGGLRVGAQVFLAYVKFSPQGLLGGRFINKRHHEDSCVKERENVSRHMRGLF